MCGYVCIYRGDKKEKLNWFHSALKCKIKNDFMKVDFIALWSLLKTKADEVAENGSTCMIK